MHFYQEDEMLMLSGIQHYMFCPRQWALIHVEQLWEENRLTAEGQFLHKNVDNPFYRQKDGSRITLRSVAIASKALGLYGFSDAIELTPSDSASDSITHPLYAGYWKPCPVEYKRGKAKPDERDTVQLAAQVICLEEMHDIHIESAFLFYGETNHREQVVINDHLRQLTQSAADEMHRVFKSGVLPSAIKKNHCNSCSLVDVCMPSLTINVSPSRYLQKYLYEETP